MTVMATEKLPYNAKRAAEIEAGGGVRVIDPADRRKRVNGTVLRINEGRGSWKATVRLDDCETPMGFDEDEIVRKI